MQRSQGASGQLVLESTQGRQSQPSHERGNHVTLQAPGVAAPAALDTDFAEGRSVGCVGGEGTTERKSRESTVPLLARASLSKTPAGEARMARPSEFGMLDDIERAVAELQVDASGMDRWAATEPRNLQPDAKP